MGAVSIVVTAKGKNINEAFKNAQAEAKEEYGSDIYNGAINNCSFTRDVTSKRPTMHPDELARWCIDNTGKREVMGWCVEQPKKNENKIKTSVERFAQKGSRKFETVYVGYELDYPEDIEVCTGKTLGECIDKARAYVEKKGANYEVRIDVEKRLVQGNKKCAVVKYKKAAGEKEGTYKFAGWAPC